MKRTAFVFILFVLILTLIPISLSFENINTKTDRLSEEKTETQAVFAATDDELIINYALKFAKTEFCDETLKVLIAVALNNSEVNPGEICSETENSNGKLYKKLKSLLDESKTEITYNNEKVYIPITELSAGYISTSDEYPYIESVASPWDCTSKDYVYDKEYSSGISVYGIDYLCKEGYSGKESLAYYLCGFEIK